MPKAKKTQSGKWKVTIYDYKDSAGRIHQKSFTAETKREAERLAAEYKTAPKVADLTVGEAVKGYIDSKKNVLSPSTHRSYMSIYRTHFESSRFGSLKLSALDNITMQLFISDLECSAKTVRNISGLLTASVQMYIPEKHFSITLPTSKRPELYTPTSGEVSRLIESVKNDRELYICVLLCAFGPLRRSEACAVRYDDIDYKKNSIMIRRARVQNATKEWVYKDMPKTDTSQRAVILPSDVICAIGRGFGYVIDESTPAAISDRFSRAVAREGLPHFRVHDLRHYSASILHAIGIPDQYIMQRGGWKTDNVMKRVYRDTISDEEKKMNDKINNYFSSVM